MVIGNAAGALHGAPVLTQDVDLLVRDTPLVRRKLKQLAARLGGVGPLDISELSTSQRISVDDGVPVDILYDQMIGGLKFASVRSRSTRIEFGENVLVVAALEDIIKSKTAAGRDKDKAVMPILLAALEVQNARKK